jgi:hypothetical protein
VNRLFSTSVGPLAAMIGPHGFVTLTRYAPDGSAAIQLLGVYAIERFIRRRQDR